MTFDSDGNEVFDLISEGVDAYKTREERKAAEANAAAEAAKARAEEAKKAQSGAFWASLWTKPFVKFLAGLLAFFLIALAVLAVLPRRSPPKKG